jgi:hypothetical protein
VSSSSKRTASPFVGFLQLKTCGVKIEILEGRDSAVLEIENTHPPSHSETILASNAGCGNKTERSFLEKGDEGDDALPVNEFYRFIAFKHPTRSSSSSSLEGGRVQVEKILTR